MEFQELLQIIEPKTLFIDVYDFDEINCNYVRVNSKSHDRCVLAWQHCNEYLGHRVVAFDPCLNIAYLNRI